MNLRTFTLREMFLWIFRNRFTVMFDAREAVHRTGHEHELEQVVLTSVTRRVTRLDHLTGEVLVILGKQDVVQVARHRAVVCAAARTGTRRLAGPARGTLQPRLRDA